MIFALAALSSAAALLEDRVRDDLGATLMRLFWLGNEQNIPTAGAFCFIAMAWLLVTLAGCRQQAVRGRWRLYWFVLSAIFLYLAYDEAAQLHEQLTDPMRSAFDAGGPFTYAWVIPGLGVVAVIGAIYLRFVIALPPQVRSLVFISGGIYVSGAIGFEMVGGHVSANPELWDHYQKVLTVEETLELFGMMLFGTAILKLLNCDTEASRRYFTR